MPSQLSFKTIKYSLSQQQKLLLTFSALVLLQAVLLPKISPYFYVDLFTPFFVICLVDRTPFMAFLIACLTSYFLETFYVVPRGFFFAAYLVLGTVIVAAKNQISWRREVSWFIVIFCGQMWLCVFELVLQTIAFLEGTQHSIFEVSIPPIQIGIRVFIALILSLTIAHYKVNEATSQ